MAPAIVTLFSGAAGEPMMRLELKSGRELIVRESAELPALIVRERPGLVKSVLTIFGPLMRERLLPAMPSSARVNVPPGPKRLIVASVAVPVLRMDSRLRKL